VAGAGVAGAGVAGAGVAGAGVAGAGVVAVGVPGVGAVGSGVAGGGAGLGLSLILVLPCRRPARDRSGGAVVAVPSATQIASQSGRAVRGRPRRDGRGQSAGVRTDGEPAALGHVTAELGKNPAIGGLLGGRPASGRENVEVAVRADDD